MRRLKCRARCLIGLPAAVALMLAMTMAVTAEEGEPPPVAKKQVDFARDIRPIFAARCIKCHGPEKQESGFRVDRRDVLLEGGALGEPAVVPGDSGKSHLIFLVAGADEDFVMPPEGDRLSATQVGLLRAWIDQGAKMPLAKDAGATNTVPNR